MVNVEITKEWISRVIVFEIFKTIQGFTRDYFCLGPGLLLVSENRQLLGLPGVLSKILTCGLLNESKADTDS